MIGLDLRITFNDGTEHTVPITYGVAIAWEDEHPGQPMNGMLSPPRFKQILNLAYQACRKANITVKMWPHFIDTVKDVEFIPKDSPGQQETTQT